MLFKNQKGGGSIPQTTSKEMNSKIGAGSIFEGKFYIAGNVQIDGKFEGEIKTEQALVVGETGKVKTNLRAKLVRLAGTMLGNISSSEEVRLERTGRLLGDITTPALIVEPGVVAQGNITITGGQKKDVKKIVEESYGSTRIPDAPGYLQDSGASSTTASTSRPSGASKSKAKTKSKAKAKAKGRKR